MFQPSNVHGDAVKLKQSVMQRLMCPYLYYHENVNLYLLKQWSPVPVRPEWQTQV